MTGAHKCNKKDIIKLHQLFDAGLNNSQIAREFVTENGKQISREHVSRIRKGQRWNPKTRSFILKDELGTLKTMETKTDKDVFYSEVGKVITKTGEKWVYLHFKNTLPVPCNIYLFDEESSAKENFITSHMKFVEDYL